MIRLSKCSGCLADSHSVGGGGKRLHLDTADTLTIDDGELDVALVTPGGVPGVLDEPVVLTVLSAVADGEDGVIEAGATLGGAHDAGLVGLEDQLVGLNGDGKRLLVETGAHLADGVRGDGVVVADGDSGGAGGVVSTSGLVSGGAGGVRVDGLELGLGAILVVLVSFLLKSTVASQVAVLEVGAINELLLGEGEELTSGNLVSTLEGSGGGEGPA